MKKYLFIAAAALAIASCSHDDAFDGSRNRVQDTYDAAFLKYVGSSIAGNQDWGFGTPASSRAMITRSITVNGDVYNAFPSANEIASYFPTTIPANADEVAELETLYAGQQTQDQWGNTQTMHNLWHIYAYKIVEGYNLKITQVPTNGTIELGGSYQNSGWDQAAGKELARPYNVYVNIDGNLTIKRNGATHFNLYILSGNVTLEADYGEQAGIISVASGSTVTDKRNSIAANQGVKIFNRGTFNATNAEKYDIGNFCTFYNEGKFTATGALTYSPGDANNSYFMNLGDDAEVTAPSMTLNSTGNFFNSGKVNISGETSCTQARLYWVNAGHYTTGSLTFSAKNTTFYNYCQLIVRGNAHMYDGEFNLMPNGYMEAGSGEMDNFIVNIASNTGLHIKGNVDIKAQGDGTFQGFHSAGSNNYLLIDGIVTVASHKKTLSIDPGITYSIKEIKIIKGGVEVTEEYLQSIGDDDYPVLDLQGTECPYGELTVDPGNYTSCGASWSRRDIIPENYDVRIIAEDLSATDDTDFDFNDVVFDVTFDEESDTKATVTLRAAGGTLPLRVAGEEVHAKFGNYPIKCMINTNAGKILNDKLKKQGYTFADNVPPVSFEVTVQSKENRGNDILVEVQKADENGNLAWYPIEAKQGKPAAKIAVDTKFEWCEERESLKTKYPNFVNWVQNKDYVWY